MLKTHGRYDYSALPARADYAWPGGKRLAIHFSLNVEHFAFGEGMGNDYAAPHPQPNTRSFGWRDYGNRVGAWRLLELAEQYHLPFALLTNAELYSYCPEMVKAFSQRGDEIVGHGRTNSERQGDLTEYRELKLIEETTAEIEKHFGQRPLGWLGPWISQSPVTPDLLQEAGYTYLLDWCHDDQPVWMKTRAGRILSVPYPQELNDIPQIVARKREGEEFACMIVDAFEVMQAECEKRPLVMGIALHPYIVGQPHRFKHLAHALRHIAGRAGERAWLTTAGEIAAHTAQLPPGTVP